MFYTTGGGGVPIIVSRVDFTGSAQRALVASFYALSRIIHLRPWIPMRLIGRRIQLVNFPPPRSGGYYIPHGWGAVQCGASFAALREERRSCQDVHRRSLLDWVDVVSWSGASNLQRNDVRQRWIYDWGADDATFGLREVVASLDTQSVDIHSEAARHSPDPSHIKAGGWGVVGGWVGANSHFDETLRDILQ